MFRPTAAGAISFPPPISFSIEIGKQKKNKLKITKKV
jgi:hypothetical protein